MDQVKIGKFIAGCRKKVNLTQAQLAERLGITDRAVSKWETGKSMPDSSVMLELCSILEITVNDLLSGEVVTVNDYNKELEKNLFEMVKQKEESDRRLLTLEWVIIALSFVVLIIPIIIGAFITAQEWQRSLIVLSGLIPALVGFLSAAGIEQSAGYYECKECGHRYVPTFRAVIFSQHMGRTRYMRCPQCNKKSWQKKVLSREK